MIDSMFQEGTDQVIADKLARPQPFKADPAKFTWGGLVKAPGQGVGGGVAESIAFGAELTGAFGQVMAATDARPGGMFSVLDRKLSDLIVGSEEEQARRKMLTTGITYSSEAGDLFRARAAEIMPDPQSTHSSAQIVAGVSKFATKAVGYALTQGPGAPVTLGLDEALTESDKLKQQGVDLATRTKAGAVAGTVAGLSVALPVAGSTLAGTAGLVAVGGPGGFMAQQQATKSILENAGYKDIAAQYDPLDPVGLALSTLVPAAFGGYALRGKLKTQADVKKAVQLTPAEQARSDAYERSPANLAELEAAVKAEKNPENRALLETELAKQRQAAHDGAVQTAVKADPEVVAAARVHQVAEAVDEMRLTSPDDITGMNAHTDALARAHDQFAAGERVEVGPELLPALQREVVRTTEFLEGTRVIDQTGAPEIVYRAADSERFAPRAADDVAARGDETPGTTLAIKDPLEVSLPAKAFDDIKGDTVLVDQARQQGKDGVVIRSDDGRKAYIPVTPEQARTPIAAKAVGAARALEKIRSAMRPPEPVRAAKTDASALEARRPEPPTAKAPAGEGKAEGTTPLSRAADEAAALNPDLIVQMEGQEPMRASELLKKVKEEAKEDAQESDFVQAAVACLLRS